MRTVMPRPTSVALLRHASRKTIPILADSRGASTEAMLIIARLAASPRSSPLSSTSMASGVSTGSRKLSRFTADAVAGIEDERNMLARHFGFELLDQRGSSWRGRRRCQQHVELAGT